MLERTRHYATAHKHDLTPRQQEVLRMIAAGLTNAEIAESLGITLDGAKFHVREILSKLGVESREEAAEWWRAQDGMLARAGRSLRGLLPAGWLKMSLAATGVAGLVVGTVVVTLALNGGSGGRPDALAALEDGPACDPAALAWTTDAVLDADPAVGARFTLSAMAATACVLRGDFQVAYGSPGSTPADVQVGGQWLGAASSPVIAGTASNLCGTANVVLGLTSGGAGVYRPDVPTPPCVDAAKPPVVAAEWVAQRTAGPIAVQDSGIGGAVCDDNAIEWTVASTPEARIGDGVRFTVSATSPARCHVFGRVAVQALGGSTTDANGSFGVGGAWFVQQTRPREVPLTGLRIGPQPTEVLQGVVRNQCNEVEDTLLVLVTSVQGSYWLGSAPPACVDIAGEFEFEVEAVASGPPGGRTPSPTPSRGVIFCDVFLGTCADGGLRLPAGYRVVAGDTYASIAAKTGYTEYALQAANPGLDATALYAGMVVRLPVALLPSTPPPAGDVLRVCDANRDSCEDLRILEPYVVQAGDTLASLTVRFAIDESALRIINADVDFDRLTPGTTIRIPK